jgi:predicted nucleic acid-binding protein
VLGREKFAQRLEQAQVTVNDLVYGYATLARVIRAQKIQPFILADPDDDRVLACALAAQAEVITSEDSHLLDLKIHQGIKILTANQLLEQA